MRANQYNAGYTKQENDWLCAHAYGTPRKLLTQMFNERFPERPRTEKAITGHCKILGALVQTSDGRFQKGHVPMNKGKRWDDFMSTEGQKNSRQTCYKKGSIPHNARHIGTETVTKDGYRRVKVAEPNGWTFVHRLIWTIENGTPPPKGYALVFLNGNTLDCSPENLALVPRRELQILNNNGRVSEDRQTTQALLTLVKLARKRMDREQKITTKNTEVIMKNIKSGTKVNIEVRVEQTEYFDNPEGKTNRWVRLLVFKEDADKITAAVQTAKMLDKEFGIAEMKDEDLCLPLNFDKGNGYYIDAVQVNMDAKAGRSYPGMKADVQLEFIPYNDRGISKGIMALVKHITEVRK